MCKLEMNKVNWFCLTLKGIIEWGNINIYIRKTKSRKVCQIKDAYE